MSRVPLPNLLPPLHSDPRGVNPSPSPRPADPFNPVIPMLREESGGKRPLHHSAPRGRNPSLGGAAHPEQSRRVERGTPHCQPTPPPSFLRRQEPIPPEGAPPAEPGPLHPFLPRHSGRREPESITGGGGRGVLSPLPRARAVGSLRNEGDPTCDTNPLTKRTRTFYIAPMSIPYLPQ